MEKPMPVAFRLTPTMKRKVDREATARGIYNYELLQEVLDAYFGKVEAGPAADVPAEYRPYMDMLAEVLSSGNPNLIGLVVTPLEFARRQLSRRPAGGSDTDDR